MYIPSAFKEENPQILRAFMQAHPFAMLITAVEGHLAATPIPWVFHPEKPHTMIAHMAQMNPHGQALLFPESALLVFQGLNSYVSPNWYPSKHEHHQVVPTWNYEMVQVRGKVVQLTKPAEKRQCVQWVTQAMESQHANGWSIDDAPADFLDRQLQAIIGLSFEIETITGKFKLSQNRPESDRQGVRAGLQCPESPFYHTDMAKKIR